MMNKKGYVKILMNPQIVLVIAGILLGYTFGPNMGLDASLGALIGGVIGFAASRYL